MSAEVEICSENTKALQILLKSPDVSFAPRSVNRRCFKPRSLKALTLVCEKAGEVHSFSFQDDHDALRANWGLSVETLHQLFDLNLKRLKISSTLHAESPSNHLHPLPLEHLELSDQHFPSFIIRPLLLAAHSLTSLSLDFDSKSVIGKSDGDAWLQIAPQLRRLHLISSREPSWVSAFRSAEDGCDGFLDYFLPACTSLSSLNLDLKYFNTLRPRLQLLNCTLRLLTTEFSLNYYEPISNGWVEEALELQSMAGLQRWRMKIWPYRGDDGEREEMLKQWTEICEQRGIEARGFERYFTES